MNIYKSNRAKVKVLIYTAEWTVASWREWICPIFEKAKRRIHRTRALSIASSIFYHWATALHNELFRLKKIIWNTTQATYGSDYVFLTTALTVYLPGIIWCRAFMWSDVTALSEQTLSTKRVTKRVTDAPTSFTSCSSKPLSASKLSLSAALE